MCPISHSNTIKPPSEIPLVSRIEILHFTDDSTIASLFRMRVVLSQKQSAVLIYLSLKDVKHCLVNTAYIRMANSRWRLYIKSRE